MLVYDSTMHDELLGRSLALAVEPSPATHSNGVGAGLLSAEAVIQEASDGGEGQNGERNGEERDK